MTVAHHVVLYSKPGCHLCDMTHHCRGRAISFVATHYNRINTGAARLNFKLIQQRALANSSLPTDCVQEIVGLFSDKVICESAELIGSSNEVFGSTFIENLSPRAALGGHWHSP